MSLLQERARQVDDADLVIIGLVEGIRRRHQTAHAASVASQIRGAPPREMARRLATLLGLGLLEADPFSHTYMVSPMGAELMAMLVGDWEPAPDEQRRRDAQLASAAAGAISPKRP